MQDFISTTASLTTSVDIIDAITYIAPDEEEAVRIWDESTRQEVIAIWLLVMRDGEISSDNCFWGALGTCWGDEIEAIDN